MTRPAPAVVTTFPGTTSRVAQTTAQLLAGRAALAAPPVPALAGQQTSVTATTGGA